jgi:hypothetical protein
MKTENKKTLTSNIPTITEVSGEGIDKNLIHTRGYTPPSDEPIKHQKSLTGLTEVWVTGNRSDLIDIVSNRACVWRDYIRQDSNIRDEDIQGNDIVLAVRCGHQHDLVTLYGLVYIDGIAKAVDVFRFYIRDGKDINFSVQGQEVFVEYGNYKDLHTRFSYDQGIWRRSPGNNRGGSGYPLATEVITPAPERMP